MATELLFSDRLSQVPVNVFVSTSVSDFVSEGLHVTAR